MDKINYLDQTTTLIIIIFLSLAFVFFGIIYSKKHRGLENYLVANRNIGSFSLTTSLVASALGTWILFGPASAATWGGIGAVIGYSLGTAFPFFILIYLGKKLRKTYPKGKTLIEVVRKRFGNKLFKLILFITIFYMLIFLIAEVTAISILVNYISGADYWITSLIIISTSLIYTLYGGLRASIFTDNIQFLVIMLLLTFALGYLINTNISYFNFQFIMQNKPILLSSNYLPNFTAGATFFIAVAATNLFHQGNWQRVYAAKNNHVLKKSLIISFLIVIPIVFLMGLSGIIAISKDSSINPDLAFFTLLLNDNYILLSIIILILAASLTISSIDTLINAISSLIVVDANKILNLKINYIILSNYIIILLSIIAFIFASKGLSILYLFLLADLICCSAVLTIFCSFYSKNFKENNSYISIIFGLFSGLLFFPSPDYSSSIITGILFPISNFPSFVTDSLLFVSFLVATFFPILTWKVK